MTERMTVQTLAMLFGAVFLVVGILGFIPGITTNYDELTVFDEEGAKLLGIFGINIIENIAHLAFGIAGLALARTWDGARMFFIGGGVIYLVLWLYGLLIDKDSGANFLGLNSAADWLHFVLGVAMIGVGIVTTRTRPVTAI